MGELEIINNLTERGGILLENREETQMNAWLPLEGNQWLQISYYPCNYPSLNVSVITITPKKLAAHIQANFSGRDVRVAKMNLPGVVVIDDTIGLCANDINDWEVAECLTYIRNNGIDYSEPADEADVNLAEVRRLCQEYLVGPVDA